VDFLKNVQNILCSSILLIYLYEKEGLCVCLVVLGFTHKPLFSQLSDSNGAFGSFASQSSAVLTAPKQTHQRKIHLSGMLR